MSVGRNTLYNLAGSALPVLAALLTIPVYLQHLGAERYGVLAIAWLLLGYFGLLDLGMGRAVARSLAMADVRDHGLRRRLLGTAMLLSAGVGLLVSLAAWPLAYWGFAEGFAMGAPLRAESLAALPWLLLAIPVTALSGVFTGALQATGQFLVLNVATAAGTVAAQVLPLAAVLVWGPELTHVLPVMLLTRLLTLGALAVLTARAGGVAVAPAWCRAQASMLLSFGGWVTVTSLVGPLMLVLDRLLIGAAVGVRAVTLYAVPFQLAERLLLVPAALGQALFPRLAAAGPDEARALSDQAKHVILAVMTPLILVAMALCGPFLAWWISPEFAQQAGTTARVLLLAFWINSLAFVPYAVLQAAGRPELVAKCHLVEVLPYAALLYLALVTWGLPGAALAFLARVAVDLGLLCWLERGATRFWRSFGAQAVLLTAVLVLAERPALWGPAAWLALAGLALLQLRWSLRHLPGDWRARLLGRVRRVPLSDRPC